MEIPAEQSDPNLDAFAQLTHENERLRADLAEMLDWAAYVVSSEFVEQGSPRVKYIVTQHCVKDVPEDTQ